MLASSFSAVGHFQQNRIGGGHGHGVQMGRIGWGGHDRRVARPDQRQAYVAEPLFRPQAGNHLPLRDRGGRRSA